MVIVMRAGASQTTIDAVAARVKADGFGTHLVQGTERTIVCVLGDGRPVDQRKYDVMEGVEKTTRILEPFKLTSRNMSAGDSTLQLNGTTVGAEHIVIMAGPCSVESRRPWRSCCVNSTARSSPQPPCSASSLAPAPPCSKPVSVTPGSPGACPTCRAAFVRA